MRRIAAKYRLQYSDRQYRKSLLFGLLFIAVSLFFNHYASSYATAKASSPVTDLVLDNVPVMNVAWIVNEGAVMFGVFILTLLILEPRKAPFVLKSAALFVSIRSCFIMFTHLGVVPDHIALDPKEFIDRLTIGGDYFFSGHTGLPFLLALIFWKEKKIRVLCLAISVIFGVSTLLGHLHYSIDVASAFFITYTIHVIATRLFARDFAEFHLG